MKGRKTDLRMMVRLLSEGKNDAQVARAMGLCRETVQKRRQSLGIAPNWFSAPGLARRNELTSARCKNEGWGLGSTRRRILAARIGWNGLPVGQAFILATLEGQEEMRSADLDIAVARTRERWNGRPTCRTYNGNQTSILIAKGLVSWRYTGAGREKLYRLSARARGLVLKRNEAHRINLRRGCCYG